MSWLSDLGVIDIRDKLPRRAWVIGERVTTTSNTWHWNGPEVHEDRQYGAGLIEQLIIDAKWQMRPGWGGTVNGAPHLMYLLVFAADGQIYQTAAEWEILWHCAHDDGNSRGLAFHAPIGVGQEPTPQMLASLFRASEAARTHYNLPLARTVGHLEWKRATACPGPALMRHLIAYRAGRAPVITPTPTPAGLRKWQISPSLTGKINVRQGPGVGFKIAGTLKPGTTIFVDVEKAAEPYDRKHPRWVHMARVGNEQADLGFIASELGRFL